MAYFMDREILPIFWRRSSGSTFHKRQAEEAEVERRMAAQRRARLAAKGDRALIQYDGELVRNARIAGRYGGD